MSISPLQHMRNYFARRAYEYANSTARRLYKETNGDLLAVSLDTIQKDKVEWVTRAQIAGVQSVEYANDPRFDADPDRYIPVTDDYAKAQEEGRI